MLTPDPSVEPPGEFLPEKVVEAAAIEWYSRLEDWYADGGPIPQGIFTEAGLDSARAYDWRLRAAEADDLRIEQEATFIAKSESSHRRGPGFEASILIDLLFEIAPGARIIDAPTGTVLEESNGPERRAFRVLLVRDGATLVWSVAAMAAAEEVSAALPRLTGSPDPCPWDPGDPPRSMVPGHPELAEPWCDASGEGVVLVEDQIGSHIGPGHCGWESVSFLYLGWPPGEVIDGYTVRQFVRDPRGEFPRGLATEYDGDARLPARAYSTGISNGHVEIWLDPASGEDAVYMVGAGRVERWPRAKSIIGCA